MALKKCKECGNEVSSKATTCPSCGAPAQKKTGCITTLVLVFGLIGIIVSVINPPTNTPQSSATPSPQATAQPTHTPAVAPSATPSVATPEPAQSPQTAAPKTSPVTRATSPTPASTPAFDTSTVTAIETPKKVALKSAEEFPVASGTGLVTVPPGKLVDVVSRSGDMLRLSYMGGSKDVHHSKTNFAADVQSARERAAIVARAAQERAEQAQKAQAAAAQAKQAAEQAKIESEAGKQPINSEWDGSVSEVEKYMKGHLKDPKSTEYIKWYPVALTEAEGRKAWAVRVKYRSKNSFGGYVIDEGIAVIRHGEVVGYQSLSK